MLIRDEPVWSENSFLGEGTPLLRCGSNSWLSHIAVGLPWAVFSDGNGSVANSTARTGSKHVRFPLAWRILPKVASKRTIALRHAQGFEKARASTVQSSARLTDHIIIYSSADEAVPANAWAQEIGRGGPGCNSPDAKTGQITVTCDKSVAQGRHFCPNPVDPWQ
jgi:hypothetical protein